MQDHRSFELWTGRNIDEPLLLLVYFRIYTHKRVANSRRRRFGFRPKSSSSLHREGSFCHINCVNAAHTGSLITFATLAILNILATNRSYWSQHDFRANFDIFFCISLKASKNRVQSFALNLSELWDCWQFLRTANTLFFLLDYRYRFYYRL